MHAIYAYWRTADTHKPFTDMPHTNNLDELVLVLDPFLWGIGKSLARFE